MTPNEIQQVLDHPVAERLLAGEVPARLAYVGSDGGPRVVPIAFVWKDGQVVMGTSTIAPKVRALRRNPAVALTIDTNEMPPMILLIRGTAELETVDGLPDEYVEASRPRVPADQWESWYAGVKALYEQMVLVRVTPTWAKVIDFETTLPQSVEELIRQKQGLG